MRLSRQGGIATTASIAVLAALAPGCGGNEDEKPQIVDVLEQTRDAVLAGDGRAACARMTTRARRKTEQLPGEGYTDSRPERPLRGCPQVIARVAADGREHRVDDAIADEAAWHMRAPDATFEVTEVSGDRAAARVEVEGENPGIRIRLRKIDGKWLIDDADGIITPGD